MARRAAVALASLLVTLALVAGMSRPAGHYFYCEAMGVLPFDPCAAAARGHDDAAGTQDETGTIHAYDPDCCDVISVPSPPRAASTHVPTVPRAALVAVHPVPGSTDSFAGHSPQSSASTPERWRTRPRPPTELRAHLMVFLT